MDTAIDINRQIDIGTNRYGYRCIFRQVQIDIDRYMQINMDIDRFRQRSIQVDLDIDRYTQPWIAI